MSQEHVYMLWDCVECGNAGIPCSPDRRFCESCGHPRTFAEFDQSYLPGSDATWEDQNHHVIPPDVVARLQSIGASWFCTNCTGDNYDDEDICFNCNAPRNASDEELRRVLDDETFVAYMDGDQGATADLVQQFGEYAGMRAAHGESFDMDDDHAAQLERAQEGRSAFRDEMQHEAHPARPSWEATDMPSSLMDYQGPPDDDGVEYQNFQSSPGAKLRAILGSKITLAIVGLVILALLVVTAVVWWGTRSFYVQGEIRDMSWERHIEEQRWTQVMAEDWEASLTERSEVEPVNGEGERAGVAIQSCQMKHHHYEQYVCGTMEVACTHMESYTESYSCTRDVSYTETYSCSKSETYSCGEDCTTTRGSNGMATRTCSPRTCTRSVSSTCTRTSYRSEPDTCTRTLSRPIHSSDTVDKMCDRSIEQSWCRYATQKWQDSDHHVEQGSELPAVWPEGSLDRLERESRRESYKVEVAYSLKDEPKIHDEYVDYATFETYARGQEVTILVNNFGETLEVYMPGEEVPEE